MIDFSIQMLVGEENATFKVSLCGTEIKAIRHIEFSADRSYDFPSIYVQLKASNPKDIVYALVLNELPWVFGVEVMYDQDE